MWCWAILQPALNILTNIRNWCNVWNTGVDLFMCLGGYLKNIYEPINLRALKFSLVNKLRIFQCMGKIFCGEFQRVPLKFHTKYLTHTLNNTFFYTMLIFSELLDLRAHTHFWNAPWLTKYSDQPCHDQIRIYHWSWADNARFLDSWQIQFWII